MILNNPEPQPEDWTCTRCTMRFNVRKSAADKTENLRCPECGVLFWSAKVIRTGKIRVGIDPEKLPA